MKLKPHHILEAAAVVLILSLLLYTVLPRALRSQKRADVVKMERAMEAIQQYFIEHPNVANFIKKSAGRTNNGWSGPWYSQAKNELTLFYYQENSYELFPDKLEQMDERFQFPDWTFSEWHVYGYAVYTKKSPHHPGWSGFHDNPAYAAVIAKVGTDSRNQLHYSPYQIEVDGAGNINVKSNFTPFATTNGLDSYGEFFVDTKDIWPATTAVLMASPIDPNIQFPGFSWDTTKIIRGK